MEFGAVGAVEPCLYLRDGGSEAVACGPELGVALGESEADVDDGHVVLACGGERVAGGVDGVVELLLVFDEEAEFAVFGEPFVLELDEDEGGAARVGEGAVGRGWVLRCSWRGGPGDGGDGGESDCDESDAGGGVHGLVLLCGFVGVG